MYKNIKYTQETSEIYKNITKSNKKTNKLYTNIQDWIYTHLKNSMLSIMRIIIYKEGLMSE